MSALSCLASSPTASAMAPSLPQLRLHSATAQAHPRATRARIAPSHCTHIPTGGKRTPLFPRRGLALHVSASSSPSPERRPDASQFDLPHSSSLPDASHSTSQLNLSPSAQSSRLLPLPLRSSPITPGPTEEEEKVNQAYEVEVGGLCDPLCSVDDMSSQEYEDVSKQEKSDLIKAVVIGASVSVVAALINLEWVSAHQNITMGVVFALGYLGIIFEESLAFNKSGVALLMAVALWVIRSICAPSPEMAYAELTEQSAEVSEIVFFLLGAMTIVEIVDAHQGFRLVTDAIQTRNARKLLWLVGTITFFLSSILDNLTSTIVMVSLLRKLVPDPDRRRFLGAVVVIAANAGGAWTPIGDVTTTMLWIHGQISTVRTMQDLFVPSLVSLAIPLALLSFNEDLVKNEPSEASSAVLASEQMAPRGRLVFGVGVGSLLFVPVFKSLTGLPPYLGMLAGLGTLWLLTDAIHYGENDRQKLRVPQALSRIDTQGVLFFLGILLAVGSLDSAGLLKELAQFLDQTFGNPELIAGAIGLASAVVDNVPLVAATMGMYDIAQVPMDDELWQLIAYCAGTGGSILVIGSAAGVAFMGMEKADFFWYLKKVSGVALVGYAAGMATYLAGNSLPTLGDITAVAAAAQLVS